MFFNNLPILYAGRVCGGIATTLLFSVFEAWMITEYHALQLEASNLRLGTIFGSMTKLSSIAAICAGVIGDGIIWYSGTATWPFLASLLCCASAGLCMLIMWRENYGGNSSRENSLTKEASRMLKELCRPKIMALGFTSCCFEGAMYLFVFFWPETLKSARAGSRSAGEVPLGIIFSSFMCAMMTGSALFSSRGNLWPGISATGVLMLVIIMASGGLSGAAMLEHEYSLFWALCLVECCVGAYFPSMAILKADAVENAVRGSIYSLLRMPLNIFVVIVHSLDREGR